MVILRNKQADNFVKSPSENVKGVLIYGQDLGLISHRSSLLIDQLVTDKNDPFQLSKLSTEILNENPDQLVNELDTYSLLSTRKVILLKLSQDLAKDQIEAIFEKNSPNMLIITASELKPTSKLRRGFETNTTDYISIPCYSSSNLDIMNILNEKLIEKKLNMNQDAKELLVNSLGDNYQNTLSEIDKILSMNNLQGSSITKQYVENLVVDSSNIIITDLVDLIFEKKTKSISVCYQKSLEEFQPQQILQIVSNHAIKLLDMKAVKDTENIPVKRIVESYKPSFFFKRHSSIQKQLGLWTLSTLSEILEIISDTIMDTRSYNEITKEITERSLLKISSLRN